MNGSNPKPSPFDLSAAVVRRGQGDLHAFMAAFAARMSGAFPANVSVVRHKGLLSRKETVEAVTVEAASYLYTLTLKNSRLVPMREQSIRGVRLRSETMDAGSWFAALKAHSAPLPPHRGDPHALLHDFLLS